MAKKTKFNKNKVTSVEIEKMDDLYLLTVHDTDYNSKRKVYQENDLFTACVDLCEFFGEDLY